MIDPGLAKPGEGVRVSVKDGVRLDDKLSRAQMPPHVRISHAARRHGEKTQSQDGHEYATRLEKLTHRYPAYSAVLNASDYLVSRRYRGCQKPGAPGELSNRI